MMAASPEWETSVGSQQAAVYRLSLKRVHPMNGMRANLLQWPLDTWKGQAETEAIKGNDPAPALAAAQKKADAYLRCLETKDAANVSEQAVQTLVTECAKQADPNWQ